MKRKLVLINPFDRRRPGLSIDKYGRFQPLAPGIIAALTPAHWDVELIDEKWNPFVYREADLVGITAFTSTASRAYELAGIYRSKGVPVVMGGIHPQMCTDETLEYVDTVVLGEAEAIWKRVIEDFEKGQLEPLYDGGLADLSEVPLPRRDLFHPGYVVGSIQTTRGCPMDCEFCSVPAFNGRIHRQRPIEDVLEELETIPQKIVLFTDDNLIGYSKQSLRRTIDLFKGMVERKLNKWWICQASLNFADNEEMLYWAKLAGCKFAFIGIESLEINGIKEVNKYLNLEWMDHFRDAFRKINKAGIAVLGSFVFGLDSDNEEKLRNREAFIVNGGLDVVQATVLTPLPGTRLFNRLKKENRLLYTNYPRDWYLYDFNKVVHQPLGMTSESLATAMEHCHKRMSSIPLLIRKALKTLWNTRSIVIMVLALKSNMVARKIARVLYR